MVGWVVLAGCVPGAGSSSGGSTPPGTELPAWPMPDSATSTCSDATARVSCPAQGAPGYGQDGTYTQPAPAYTTTADTVADGVTDLTWQRAVPLPPRTWWDARSTCEGLVLGGDDDWRLPTRVELVTLLDVGRSAPSVDPTAFPDTPADETWTSTPLAGDATASWTVNFAQGGLAQPRDNRDEAHRVRCVRGGPPPVSREAQYVANNDGVHDTRTDLTWQREAPPVNVTWLEALASCEALTLTGYTTWRLPSLKELLGLVDPTRTDPAVDLRAFPSATSFCFWTSTPLVDQPDHAFSVDFLDGHTRQTPTVLAGCRARCVR